MICPKCQQPGAKYSTYYPDLLVHKCDGHILQEVGDREKPILPADPPPISFLDHLRERRRQGHCTIAPSTIPTDYPE